MINGGNGHIAVPAVKPYDRIPERYAVLVIDPEYGGLIELTWTPGSDHRMVVRKLLAAMALVGRKVTNNREAAVVFRDVRILDGWITGRDLGEYKAATESELRQVLLYFNRRYRGRPDTFGASGPLRLTGGDDFGMEVDGDGYVARLLSGHIR